MLPSTQQQSINRTRVLRQLVSEEMYVIDDRVIADAILMRAQAKMIVPDVPFRNDTGERRKVRSFRLEHDARSFRISSKSRRRQLTH
jgi:hypothetical protein